MPVKTVSLTANAVYQRPAYDIPPRVLVITNTDKTNPVYYSTGPGTINAQSSQIPPGSAETFDGLDDVWMSTLSPAISILVDYKIGSQNFSPGSLAIIGNVNATVSGSVAISGGSLTATVSGPVQIEPTPGTPLDVSAAVVNISAAFILPGNKGNLFQLGSAQTIAASSGFSVFSPPSDIRNFSACDISLFAHCASQNAVGAPLTGQLTLQWCDDAAGTNAIYEEDWFFWVMNTGTGSRAIGSFPMRGQYLKVIITNNSSAASISLDFLTITGTYRTPVYSSFRQLAPPTNGLSINGASVTKIDPAAFSNNLGSIPNATPGTGLRVYPLPLYAGPVSYYWSVNTASLVNFATLIDMSSVTSGNLVAGTSQSGLIKAFENTTGTSEAMTVNFPRSPVGLVVNPAATSQIQFSAIGQQGY